MTTRGLRNNNPGNIDRHVGVKWQGMSPDQSGDPRFIVFVSPEYGIRAIAKLMMTYQLTHGLHTITGLISRWAPPGENNTTAYINAVAKAVGVAPDAVIDVDRASTMIPLVEAIITHENGSQPYPDDVIRRGVALAGVSDILP